MRSETAEQRVTHELPPGPPSIRMNWANLLFLHWRVDPAVMRKIVPEPLELDLFDGSAWVGLVPFRMEACAFRGFGWAPGSAGLRDFYECNVRTYATYRGVRGVWFLSLDAETMLPVIGGRWFWNLNYVRSRFDVKRQGSVTDYKLARVKGPWPEGATQVSWRTGRHIGPAAPGTLEHFLVERYWLFAMRGKRVQAGRVHHAPWQLHEADVFRVDDSLVSAGGVQISGTPHVLASPMIEVKGWSLRDL